jgi:arylsulfatase A-like enzyme
MVWAGVLILAMLVSQALGQDDRPNIVVIISDALRPDHLGCYGYNRPTSPNIDMLSQEGVVFETVITQAPWTKSSFSSLLSSTFPFQHGVVDWISKMPDTLEVLPEVLAENGYHTICVMNMVGMAGRFGVLRGFAETSVTGKFDRNATKTTDDAIALIESAPEPFFLLIHYFDTHQPYKPPADFVQLIAGETASAMTESARDSLSEEAAPRTAAEIERHITLYDACVRYVDSEIGRILNALQNGDMRSHTIVAISADHGEAFWEHDVGGHGRTLYDEEIKVPLVVSLPGRYDRPRRVSRQVRMVDLAATIVDLAGAEVPKRWEGVSLLALVDGGIRRKPGQAFLAPQIALTETSMRKGVLPVKSLRTDAWKVVIQPATGLAQVYNLREDPAETSDLRALNPAPADTLLRILETIPGARVAGWRMAFTGEMETVALDAVAELPKGSRFTRVDLLASRGEFEARIDDDENTLFVRSNPRDLNLLIFGTEPDDVEIRFTVRVDQGDADSVYVGKGGSAPTEDVFRLSRSIAFGLPENFEKAAESQEPGAFIWWLPGGKVDGRAQRRDLSPEEKQRLKSLGYIQ